MCLKLLIKVSVVLSSGRNDFFDEIKRGIFYAENNYSSYVIDADLIEFKGYGADKLIEKID